ncbi:aminotransferase class IV [Candidatus Pelagibacter sp.]|nr:aminotransferase class IV [Candidatus Pelagibacter sp.]
MAIYSLKRSYQLKDLQELGFKDLWGDHGIFTTMWIFGKPPKILFFENHIKNLIRSLKIYGIKKRSLKKNILEIINKNLSRKINYNHLLRVAVNKKIISISLRKKVSPKSNFDLKLTKLKRENSQYKNLKYKKILSHLKKLDNSKSDIGLISNKKILETGTSNLLFVKRNKIYTPIKGYYEGNTFKFFKSKIKRIIKKDVFVNDLKSYDEILLVGSGKGIASIKTIKQIGWKRKNLKTFKVLSKYFESITKKCSPHRF